MRDSSLARSSVIMAAGTFTSRILGVVRNALLIAALGATASGAADAFNVANMLPTQLYNLIIGGVLNAILVPQIVRTLRLRNGEELVNRLLTAASLLIAGIAAVLTVCAPLVIMIYASGLGRWQPLAFAFAFWCMPQVFFYGLYALWGQVLNAKHNFGPYMWAPVLNNIISIASILAYLHLYGHYTTGTDPAVWNFTRITLIGGFATLGIAAQALILYIPLRHIGFKPRLVFGVRGLGLGSMSKVALWALLGTAIVSLGDLAVTNLGSRAVTAAESPLYAHVIIPSTTMYSNALLVYMLPQSLITTSIITALFTRMSEKAVAGNRTGVRDDLSLGLRSIGVFTVLFAAGIATLASPALQLFVPSISLAQANASAPVLAVLAIGIVFQGAWFTTQRVMLAYADTKRLVRADCLVGVIAVGSCLLAWLLAPPQYWMALAAAGNVVSLAVACIAVIPLLRRHLPDLDGAHIISTYLRLIACALPAVAVGWLGRWILGPADASITGTRALDALVIIVICALLMTLTYLVGARLLKVSELNIVFQPLSRLMLAAAAHLPNRAQVAFTRFGNALVLPSGAASAASAANPIFKRPNARIQKRTATNEEAGNYMGEGTPIGSGRYRLLSPLPAVLPHMLRHSGWDAILDRPVTILSLNEATPNRSEVLEAAARAVLVEDLRIQRVYDVEYANPAFIVTEPVCGRTLSSLIAPGLSGAQVRAIIGEVAQALDACSRRDLHHLNMSPDSIRIRDNGQVQVCGVGIEGAVLGLGAQNPDPLEADKADAQALVELLYYALTKHWPGKHVGIPSAPMRAGIPVAAAEITGIDNPDLDALIYRTWHGIPPRSAREIADSLAAWDVACLATAAPTAASASVTNNTDAEAKANAGKTIANSFNKFNEWLKVNLVKFWALTSTFFTSLWHKVSTSSLVAKAKTVLAKPAATPAATSAPLPDSAPAPAPAASAPAREPEALAPTGEFAKIEIDDAAEPEDSSSISRSTVIVLLVAVLVILAGVVFAVSNLLNLSKVEITDDEIPAAKTVPSASSAAAADPNADATDNAQPAAAAAAPVISNAQALDPYGDNNEHPELAAKVYDGDPNTSWYSRYYASSSLAWKQGLGIAVTLAQPATVSGINIQGTGAGGNVQIRATTPEDPQGGTLLAEGAFTADNTSFTINPTETSSLVLWITELPKASDGLLKATIAEITLT